MKNKKWASFILAALIFNMLVGCSSAMTENQIEEAESSTEAETAIDAATENKAKPTDTEAVYQNILDQEYVELDEAYQQLHDCGFLTGEAAEFADYLSEFINCEGIFVQESEDTGDRYTAEVLFYLQNGEVRCSIEYSGYMGDIADAIVEESDDSEYVFASFPKGDLFGREQDFQIHFSPEFLHIEWANTCEYILSRGNGDVDYAQDYTVPFEETEVYQDLLDTIDGIFEGYAHDVIFDSDDKTMYIYFSVASGLKSRLVQADDELLENWQGVVDNMTDLGEQIYTILQIGDFGDEVAICCVDTLYTDNIYTDDDYLLRISNDHVQYNIANDYTIRQDSVISTADNTAVNTISTATTGEKNALEQAHNYLSIMAFSYSGLIEQLEYEGYSYSEAVYAADNCGADWYEQAAYKAADYLEIMSFSRSGLIEQLEYEGFTYDQASYGVDAVY